MEPVRRRVVGESAGKILSMENPVDPELLKKLFADLENINEDVRLFSVKYSALIKGGDPALATVLRCHLVAEHFLSEYLAAANPAVVDWDGARLTFAQKLALAENAMSAVAFITPGLACLNRARNRFSHRLDVVLDSTDLGPIEEIMRIWNTAGGYAVPVGLLAVEEFTFMACSILHSAYRSVLRHGKGKGLPGLVDYYSDKK